jgi:hypothetical protein
MPAAWLLLLPGDLTSFARSVVAVATFSSNILFVAERARVSMSAFTPKADIRPRDQDVCVGPQAEVSKIAKIEVLCKKYGCFSPSRGSVLRTVFPQEAENELKHAYLRDVDRGYFVEVGANQAEDLSQTFTGRGT